MFSFGKKKGLRNLSKRPISKKKKFFLVILLTLVLISLVVFGGLSLKVKNIEASSGNAKCLEGVNLEGEIGVLNKNIFLLDEKLIESNLKKKYSCVESLEIKRKLPFTVIASAKGKRAVFELILNKKSIFADINSVEATASTQEATLKVEPNNSSGTNYLVDENGKIFAKASDSGGLQKIEYVEESLELEQVLDRAKVQNALSIFNKLREFSVPVTRVIWDGDSLFFDDRPQLLFSLKNDPLRQSASLQLILQKAKMDSKEMDKIDLRFDKIIVVYSPKKK